MTNKPFIHRFTDALDHGTLITGGLSMPLIGSLDPLSPDTILIIRKKPSSSKYGKLQSFDKNTHPDKIYRSLYAWGKQAEGHLMITTTENFLKNPSSPRPLHFYEKQEPSSPSFLLMDFEL